VLKPTFATKSRVPTDTALIYLSSYCYCSVIDNKNGLDWSLIAGVTALRVTADHHCRDSSIARFQSICEASLVTTVRPARSREVRNNERFATRLRQSFAHERFALDQVSVRR
jgi:hypothetical protein